MTLVPMTPASEPPTGPYVVMAAWHCDACDVQGRSPADGEPTCWNCDGQVIVTARPSLRLEEPRGEVNRSLAHIPGQRTVAPSPVADS